MTPEDQAKADEAHLFAQLDAILASMQPGVKPHRSPFSKMATRMGLTAEQFEAWAQRVPNWDPTAIPPRAKRHEAADRWVPPAVETGKA